MPPVNTDPAFRARKMHSLILQRIHGSQSAIAAAMGVSESAISRFKGEQLEMFCRVLAHAGIKAVPAELKCYDPRELDALFVLARGQFDRAQSVDDVLRWEED